MSERDVIVVGGGHNGLVAAAYLARAGARVLVLERRPWVGGACVTEEPWPGFRINTYSYIVGLLRPQVVRDLELRAFGYEPLVADPQSFVPFPDGRALTFWRDAEKTARGIAAFSAEDARRYVRYEEFWSAALARLEPLLLRPPAPLADLAGAFRGDEGEETLRSLFLLSASDFLDEWFESPELKAALAAGCMAGTMTGPRTPGTAYVLAHHAAAQLNGGRGWGFSRGGMGRIAEAIAASARRFGAEIRTGAGVRSILVRDGRAIGVETETGERVEARAIASSLDAPHTLLRLLPPDILDADFAKRVARIRMDATTLKLNAALDGVPGFRAAAGRPGPHHRGSVVLAPSVDDLERVYHQAKRGAFSDPPFEEVVFQSVVDPTVAPPRKHTMTCSVRFAPRRLSGTTWEEFAPRAAEIALDTLEAYAPDVRRVLRSFQVVTPETIERTLGMTGASCYHGNLAPAQMFGFRPLPGWAHYRTPVPGLYLCGAATHPGGGVMGAAGHNAAQVLLEDLRAVARPDAAPTDAPAPGVT